MRERRIALIGGAITGGVVGARRYGRFDDEVVELGQRYGIAGVDEGRRHDGNAGARELGEVALISAPPQHRRWVEQHRSRGHAIRPGQELVATREVVPRRAHDRRVEALPLDGCVVPHDDLGCESEIPERPLKQRQILVEPKGPRSGDERDAASRSHRRQRRPPSRPAARAFQRFARRASTAAPRRPRTSEQLESSSPPGPEWRNGRRRGLKIPRPQGRVGSTPTSGTSARNDARQAAPVKARLTAPN